MSDAKLEARANAIKTALTGNPSFPTPDPGLAEFQTAINDFSTAAAKAEKGSQNDKDVKNQLREALIVILHSLGNYVLFTANGDIVVARSSGFTVAKQGRTPAPAVMPATGQELSDGPNAGELDLRFKRVPGAKSYVYQTTPEPLTEASLWYNQAGTASKTRFAGLQSGKRYWCRVMAIGTGGQTVYSEPLSRVVQ